jgi:hypothetical protein
MGQSYRPEDYPKKEEQDVGASAVLGQLERLPLNAGMTPKSDNMLLKDKRLKKARNRLSGRISCALVRGAAYWSCAGRAMQIPLVVAAVVLLFEQPFAAGPVPAAAQIRGSARESKQGRRKPHQMAARWLQSGVTATET